MKISRSLYIKKCIFQALFNNKKLLKICNYCNFFLAVPSLVHKVWEKPLLAKTKIKNIPSSHQYPLLTSSFFSDPMFVFYSIVNSKFLQFSPFWYCWHVLFVLLPPLTRLLFLVFTMLNLKRFFDVENISIWMLWRSHFCIFISFISSSFSFYPVSISISK